MSTQLTGPTTGAGTNGTGSPNGAGPGSLLPAGTSEQRKCSKCGAPMQPLQDWCLQCGAGAPGSLAQPSRAAAAIALAAVILLVAGASAASYAALSKKGKAKPPVVAAAKTPLTTASPPTPSTPATPGTTTTPGSTTPGATTPGTPTTLKSTTPPKIPLQTPTPSPSEGGTASGPNEEANNALFGGEGGKSSTPSSSGNTTKTTTPSKPSGGTNNTSNGSNKASSEKSSAPESGAESGSGANGNGGSEPPSPILLDTNAASTYNPYTYPSTLFGDPSLAIDGEAKTAWTAQVDAASAPKMAEGLVLDMRTAQSVGSAIVKTTTTGMTVTMYGANGHNLPASITDTAWKRLSGSKVLKKKSTKIVLKTKGTAYRFVLLWITKAPSGSTPSKPGSVSIDELELFPPS